MIHPSGDATNKLRDKIIPGWAYREKAAQDFADAPFADVVARAIEDGVKKGVETVSIDLPRLYKQKNDKGRSLRGRLVAAMIVMEYRVTIIDNEGFHWWKDDEPGTADNAEKTAAERLLDAESQKGETERHPNRVELTPREPISTS